MALIPRLTRRSPSHAVLILRLLASVLCLTATTAHAQTARVVVDGATIWTTPAGPSVAMTTVKAGTPLTVVSRQDNWLQVLLPFDPTRSGYIQVAQVALDDSAPAPGATDTAPVAPRPDAPTAGASPSLAATSGAMERRVTIPRVATAPKLEAFLSEDFSAAGVRVTDFRQRSPGDGTPSSLETTAYLSYDDTNLYIAFVCHDQQEKVRGRMSSREDIGDDDTVSVFLDTFHDGQHAYRFSSNPLGVQADGLITDGGGGDGRFDTLWKSDGRLTPTGYIVLFSIPFKSLRFSDERAQTWGIALQRSAVHNGETSLWPYITRRQRNFVQQMGVAEGLIDIASGRNIRLIPYGSLANARVLDQSEATYDSQHEARGGLDAKVVLTNGFTLDTTINPDFGQVESDDPQVTINQRYEVIFPEKRPFFLENINFFDTPISLVFTRRIVDPEFGARATGKAGQWNLGFLGIDDRAPGKSSGPLFGNRAVIAAARVQRIIGGSSTIGGLATSRAIGGTSSRLVAGDTRLRLSPTWYFSGQLAHADHSQYARNGVIENLRGSAGIANLSYAGRHFSYSSDYRDISAGFRAPLGYVKRTDIRTASESAAYLFLPEGSKIYDVGPNASVSAVWDHNGQLLDRNTYVAFQMDAAGPVGFTLGWSDVYERYLGTGFHPGGWDGSFYVNSLKRFSFYGGASLGRAINYAPPSGLAPFTGRAKNYNLGFAWRPAQRFRAEQFYYWTRLDPPETLSTSIGASAVFVSRIARTKVHFQFTRALSLRAILDYYDLLPNAALFDSDVYKTLTGDVLLTYLLRPSTGVYFGYNNQRQNLATDPSASPALRRFGGPDYETARQFYLKVSYLIPF